MKLPLGFAFLLPLTLHAAQERFYIGDYTGPGRGEGIYASTLDTDTGKLGPITLAAKANGPGYLALSPDATHLYAATSDDHGSASAFSIARDGSLTFLSRVPTGGGSCYISVDPAGKNALVGNYSSGSVSSVKIAPDGSVTGTASNLAFTGSGPDPDRQKHPFGHFIIADATGQFIYACDLGTDHVWSYHFDPATGQFGKPTGTIGTVPPGSGPRHLAFGPGQDFAYVNGEMGRNVTTFKHDKTTGALTAIQTLPLVPGASPDKTVTTAEIVCHPNGKFIYVSSRGDDILAVFSIGPDGKLTFVQSTPSIVKFPRGFGIDPTGKWLVDGGQNDNQLAVFAIDPATGKLTPNGETAKTPCPICITFMPQS